MTFEDVYNLWMKQHYLKIKATTYDAKQSKFKKTLDKFWHIRIDKLTLLYYQQVINEWEADMESFNDYKIQANPVFKYTVKYVLIPRNPMEDVTNHKKQKHLIFDED